MPAPHTLINLNCIGSASQMHLQKQISVKVIFADFVWRGKSLYNEICPFFKLSIQQKLG